MISSLQDQIKFKHTSALPLEAALGGRWGTAITPGEAALLGESHREPERLKSLPSPLLSDTPSPLCVNKKSNANKCPPPKGALRRPPSLTGRFWHSRPKSQQCTQSHPCSTVSKAGPTDHGRGNQMITSWCTESRVDLMTCCCWKERVPSATLLPNGASPALIAQGHQSSSNPTRLQSSLLTKKQPVYPCFSEFNPSGPRARRNKGGSAQLHPQKLITVFLIFYAYCHPKRDFCFGKAFSLQNL